MRKKVQWIWICLLSVWWVLPALTAQAGNINAEEQRLIDAADKSYTYDGKTYKPSDSAKERAMNYLMQDDVDLTKEQVDKAIGMLAGSVEKGIANGYLVEEEGQSKSSTDKGKDSGETAQESAAQDTATQTGTSVQPETTASTEPEKQATAASQSQSAAAAEPAVESQATESTVQEAGAAQPAETAPQETELLLAENVPGSPASAAETGTEVEVQASSGNLWILAGIIVLIVVLGGGFLILQKRLQG
ncbi:MAG: hypothetical protein IJ747_02535 [Lachnospiraceae bacterium]|nr:hypothetical protein [Lachnospiraceae bacterium]